MIPPTVPGLARTVDAVILDRDAVMSRLDCAAARTVRRLATRLRAHGVHMSVADTTDVDAIRSQLETLGAVGITPGLVLIVGADPGSVPALLEEQLRRRRLRRVPAGDDDPRWRLCLPSDGSARGGPADALLTLGAAGIATRGVREETTGAAPVVFAAGVYDGAGPAEHLLPAPAWTALGVDPAPVEETRILDLRAGLLIRAESTGPATGLTTVRFMSIARPGVVAMRAEAAVGRLRAGPALCPVPGVASAEGRVGPLYWARSIGPARAGVGAVARQRSGRDGPVRVVERIAAYTTSAGASAPADARSLLDDAERAGFDRLLAEHRAAWARRWQDVNVEIPDDPAAELTIRYALFQLWCNADSHGELALGARGLSGPGYSGHVFWDSDVFVLPALATMDPAAAEALVQYRLRRLGAARAAARAAGRSGARFPWESAATGVDVTPRSGSVGGEPVAILTGQYEEHITADVVWGAVHLTEWTGSRPARSPELRALLAETARYWASRARTAGDSVHIDQVIGPDEYHERVDDNAFTNVMARWNLRTAAALLPDDPESARWRDLAERMVDGYDPATGRYEQFAGYHRLEPLCVADFAAAPVAADVLLGRERIAASQVIKQPDVLMLHHLIPDEVHAGSLAPNLDYYEPRTAHGSSLSPAISAALLARAARPDAALRLLRLAMRLDLDDLTGSTSAGLHMAAFGGVWQAVVFGFLGARVRAGALLLDPCLPSDWGTLRVRMRCLDRRVAIEVGRDTVEITADGPLTVHLLGAPEVRIDGHAVLAARPEVGAVR